MQRLKGRSIVFGALAVLACSGDPTGNESTPTVITANPDVVFVPQGDSQAVIVSVVDEHGQILQSDPTVSDVGAGIAVDLDPNFQAVTTENPIGRQIRFFVKAMDLTSDDLHDQRARAQQGHPGDLRPQRARRHDQRHRAGARHAGDAHDRPACSSPIRASSPRGLPQVIRVRIRRPRDRLPASAELPPPAVVSNIGVNSNPNLVFTLATPDSIHTDSITAFPSSISSTTPAGCSRHADLHRSAVLFRHHGQVILGLIRR